MSVHPRTISVALALIALLLPLRMSADGQVVLREAACSGGTCCPEPKSDCIINDILTANSYAKLSGSRCKAPEVKPVG